MWVFGALTAMCGNLAEAAADIRRPWTAMCQYAHNGLVEGEADEREAATRQKTRSS